MLGHTGAGPRSGLKGSQAGQLEGVLEVGGGEGPEPQIGEDWGT